MRHRDQRHRQGGQRLQHQRGQEGRAQGAHRGPAVGLAGRADPGRLALAPGPAPAASAGPPAGRAPGRRAAAGRPAGVGPGDRVLSPTRAMNSGISGSVPAAIAGAERVLPEDHGQRGRGHRGRQQQLGQVPGEVAVEAVQTAGDQGGQAGGCRPAPAAPRGPAGVGQHGCPQLSRPPRSPPGAGTARRPRPARPAATTTTRPARAARRSGRASSNATPGDQVGQQQGLGDEQRGRGRAEPGGQRDDVPPGGARRDRSSRGSSGPLQRCARGHGNADRGPGMSPVPIRWRNTQYVQRLVEQHDRGQEARPPRSSRSACTAVEEALWMVRECAGSVLEGITSGNSEPKIRTTASDGGEAGAGRTPRPPGPGRGASTTPTSAAAATSDGGPGPDPARRSQLGPDGADDRPPPAWAATVARPAGSPATRISPAGLQGQEDRPVQGEQQQRGQPAEQRVRVEQGRAASRTYWKSASIGHARGPCCRRRRPTAPPAAPNRR